MSFLLLIFFSDLCSERECLVQIEVSPDSECPVCVVPGSTDPRQKAPKDRNSWTDRAAQSPAEVLHRHRNILLLASRPACDHGPTVPLISPGLFCVHSALTKVDGSSRLWRTFLELFRPCLPGVLVTSLHFRIMRRRRATTKRGADEKEKTPHWRFGRSRHFTIDTTKQICSHWWAIVGACWQVEPPLLQQNVWDEDINTYLLPWFHICGSLNSSLHSLLHVYYNGKNIYIHLQLHTRAKVLLGIHIHG